MLSAARFTATNTLTKLTAVSSGLHSPWRFAEREKNVSTSTPSSNLQGNLTELFTLAKNNKASGVGKQQTNPLAHCNGL
jgi:hypothetical protein